MNFKNTYLLRIYQKQKGN